MALIRLAHALDPINALLTVQRELEQVLDNPLLGFDLGVSGRGVFPPVNVFSDAEGYVVRVEVPGVSTDQVTIEAQGQTLTITGRRDVAVPKGAAFHRRERAAAGNPPLVTGGGGDRLAGIAVRLAHRRVVGTGDGRRHLQGRRRLRRGDISLP